MHTRMYRHTANNTPRYHTKTFTNDVIKNTTTPTTAAEAAHINPNLNYGSTPNKRANDRTR